MTQLALGDTSTPNAPLRLHARRESLISFKAKGRTRPTAARMKQMLRAYGVTVEQFTGWMGADLGRVLAANPGWTERQWAELVKEQMA